MQFNQPIVFFPGTLCDERVWMPVWQQLDLPQRAYVPLQWADTMEHMQALTQDRIDAFDAPVHLVGFSLGGYVASLYALKYPHRVASLTLIGYNSDGLSQQEMQQRKQIISAIDSKKYAGMNKARLAHFVHSNYMNQANVVDTVMSMSSDLGASVLKAHIQSSTPRTPLTKALSTLGIPIHLVAGDDDQIAPPSTLKAMHQQFDASSLHLVSNSGHMLPLEQPQKLANIVISNLQ